MSQKKLWDYVTPGRRDIRDFGILPMISPALLFIDIF